MSVTDRFNKIPVWNKETIVNQQIMNEHLANFRREYRLKNFKSIEQAKVTVLK